MNKEESAYIAGFLDGDGCITMQLVFRHDYRLGYQIRASVVFYQKSQYRSHLEWLRECIGYGYLRDRKDGMSELTIVGPKPVQKLLEELKPFIRLKEKQVAHALSILISLPSGRKMNASTLYTLSKRVDHFADLNYSKKRNITSETVRTFLESRKLYPVETDS